MFIDIDHIQLAAPKNSEAAYRHFFHDILGMPEIEKPDNLKKTRWRMVQVRTT